MKDNSKHKPKIVVSNDGLYLKIGKIIKNRRILRDISLKALKEK